MAWIFRILGRMGARRDGFVYFRAGDGSCVKGTSAALRLAQRSGRSGLLRRTVVCVVPGRLGLRVSVGPCRGQVWPRADADADDSVVFAVHILVLHQHARVAT